MDTNEDLGIRPLQDVIVDEIREAVRKAGSPYKAAPLLGIRKATIHNRLREGYSDGNKPRVVYGLDKENRSVVTYDWKRCDRARSKKK